MFLIITKLPESNLRFTMYIILLLCSAFIQDKIPVKKYVQFQSVFAITKGLYNKNVFCLVLVYSYRGKQGKLCWVFFSLKSSNFGDNLNWYQRHINFIKVRINVCLSGISKVKLKIVCLMILCFIIFRLASSTKYHEIKRISNM